MRGPASDQAVSAAPQVHLHIGRVIVDAGVDGVDVRTLPAALESALSARFSARGTQQEPPRVPSTSDAIADAIAAQLTPAVQSTGDDRG